ncbi:MAG TPA: S41 family peptidase [Stellaceae bacterium]|nr:S41 family peptidase [Stellaceae bacterium]
MSHRALRSSRNAVTAARAGLALALLALAACAGQQTAAIGPEGKLFARGLGDISDLYIQPISSRRLALAGMARLSRLDSQIVVSDSLGNRFADSLSLGYGGRDINFFAAPADNDARGWGALVDTVVAAAKQASPRLAALPQEAIDTAVFTGISSALDRFSHYAPPEQARDLRAARNGFGGIGVTVDTVDNAYRVTAVTPHSPAEIAGIQPEDQIVSIDGVATAGCPHHEVVDRLRGPIGSAVQVKVLHPGTGQPRDVRLQRDYVVLPTVTPSRDGNIAIFQIASFNRSTTQRLAKDLADAERQAGGRLAGIVLDLRGNPGGLLDQAASLSDLFIRKGPIVSTTGRHPASRQYFAAAGDAVTPQLPIVVLVNGGSASAAEIVAAALQDAGRAVVIGSSSYGKGTVQTVLRLPNDGEFTVTWARLIAPSGYLLQGHGVVPTVCTASLPSGAGGPPGGPQQITAAPSVVPASSPRAALDDAGWAELRRACPPSHARPAIDLQLAERLLASPELYSAALHALPAAPQLAQNAVSPAP